MNSIEIYNSLAKIAYLIQIEETGSLEEFAQKCEIKKRTLYNRIEMLREFAAIEDAKILYDGKRKTYYFSPRGKFTDFKFKTI